MKTERDTKTGQFVKGYKGGPGRPKGSRNVLGEAFLADLQTDWANHGPDVIKQVRINKPADYLKVVASILPKELNVNVNEFDDVTDDELIARLRELARTIRPFLDSAGDVEDSDGTGSPTTH